MPDGAAHHFDDANDVGNLVDSNLNSLEMGANVYQTPGQLLQINVTAINYWRPTAGNPDLIAFAGATAQGVTPSTTNFVFIDVSGSLVINQSGFPAISVQHIRLAQVITSATEITSVSDERAAVSMPTSGVGTAAGGLPLLASIPGIDAKVPTTTDLFTVPSGQTAIVIGAIIRCTAAAAITVPATLGIGLALGEDDIVPSQQMVNLLTSGKAFVIPVAGVIAQATATQIIKLGIDIAAVGTSQTFAVDLVGYLV